jgi:hypothetical protein
MEMAMDRKAFLLLPSPDGGHVTVQVGSDFLPGVEAFPGRFRLRDRRRHL